MFSRGKGPLEKADDGAHTDSLDDARTRTHAGAQRSARRASPRARGIDRMRKKRSGAQICSRPQRDGRRGRARYVSPNAAWPHYSTSQSPRSSGIPLSGKNPGGESRRRSPRSAPALQAANQGAGYRARRRRFRRNLLGSFKGLSGLLQSGPFRSEGLEYCSEPMGYGLVLRLTGLQVMPKRHVGNLQNRPVPIKLWIAREEYGWD